MSFSIRPATGADAARLGTFAADRFREAYGATHPEPTLGAYLAECFGAEAMKARLADRTRRFLVVEADAGEWLGYAELRSGPPETTRATLERPLPSGRSLEIVRFYVASRYHGQGVAQALMRACEEVAAEAGHDVLWLQAWQEAAQALRFYRKEGFEVYGTAVFPFGERLDRDYLLVRRLRPVAARQPAG